MKARRGSTLLDTAPVIAKALSDKLGVKVHMGASVATACTNGAEIWIPRVNPEDESARDLIMGFIDHEAGHVKETDFKVELAHLLPALARVVQCFEDIRQEAAFSLRFPGTRSNLNRLVKRAHELGFHGDPDRFDGFESVLFWMNNDLRVRALGMDASRDFAERSRKQLDLHCPGAAEKLLPLMDKVAAAEDTAEVVEIADATLDLLKELFPEEPPKNQSKPDDSTSDKDEEKQADDDAEGDQDQGGQAQGDQDEQSPNGQSDQDADDTGNGGGADGSDGSDGDQSGTDDAGQQPAKSASGAGAGNGASPQAAEEQQRKIAQQIRDPNAELAEVDMGDLIGKEIKASNDPSDEVTAMPINQIHQGQRHVNPDAAQRATSRLRAKLLTLLDTHRHTPAVVSRRGRKIDQRYLSRLAFKDPRVFVTPITRQQLDTYVHILVDGSGSMGDTCAVGTYMDLAMQAAFACCLAMEGIHGVTREASVFGGAACGGVGSLVKASQRARPENFPTSIYGGTPLASSLMTIAPTVALNRAQRRIVIVMTDGHPDCVESAQKVIDLYTRTGIEMVGVGIATMAVEDLFPRHQVINDVADLPNAMTALLGSLLTRAAA